MSALSRELRMMRRMRNLSVAELARRIGITRNALANVEGGRRLPSPEVVMNTAVVCQYNPLRLGMLAVQENDSPSGYLAFECFLARLSPRRPLQPVGADRTRTAINEM